MGSKKMAFIALGIAVILGVPVIGMALTAPAATVVAGIQIRHEILEIRLLPPMENRNDFYGGAVIPVRVVVLDDAELVVSNATVTVWVNGQPATAPGHSFMDNIAMSLGNGEYRYNLETKPYPAGPGSDPVAITIKAMSPDDRTGELTVLVSLD